MSTSLPRRHDEVVVAVAVGVVLKVTLSSLFSFKRKIS